VINAVLMRLDSFSWSETTVNTRGAVRVALAGALPHPAPVVAPWPDSAGRPIKHGERLAHPDGTSFIAVRLNGFESETDAWRAVYESVRPDVARLCLQIGDKGMAVVTRKPLTFSEAGLSRLAAAVKGGAA
jgi:hypothetical protein